MAFYEKEVATKCWYPSAMGADASVNHFLAPQSDPLLMTTPNLLNVCRPPPSAYGVSGVDTATSGFLQSPLTQTTSETDSGTATTTTPTEHFGRPHMNKQKSLYKTELCRSWEEKGRCPYGNKCQFAHGMQELRPVARHPKFKTEVCCTFVTTGTCPYGRRCRFIHKNVPITAVGKQVCDITKKNEPYISSANSITASSRRLPIFVKLARGEL